MKTELVSAYGPEQFGFRPNSSTLLSQIALSNFAALSLDNPNVMGVAVLALDMSKAFDRLNHRHLVNTLKRIGFPTDFILWCTSFLENRKQQVKIRDVKSCPQVLHSGVPQGSRLSPYLFSCHMGSLMKTSSPISKIFKYADDIIIVAPLYKGVNIDDAIRTEISNVGLWCRDNGLILNEAMNHFL